jgi:hypothetical protein
MDNISNPYILTDYPGGRGWDSSLIQDEPEKDIGFSHKMSLKGRVGMLGINQQHGRFGSDETGAGPGVSGRQRRGAIFGTVPGGNLCLPERTLMQHQYAGLSRPGKGLLGLYVARMTGLSRARVTRLIASYADTGRVKAAPY